MKKYHYIFLFSLLLILGSCTDLQEDPIGILAPESFFSSKADAEAAVLGAYAPMISYLDYQGFYYYFVEAPTDMVQNVTYYPDEENNFTATPNNYDVQVIWEIIYKSISGANNAIDGIPLVENMEEVDKMQFLAEAKAIRAFNYFRLVRLYGDIPYIDEFVREPSTVADLTRTPASDVYAHIIEDLEFAIQHLPDKNSSDFRSRITKGTALTILADVYLTLGNWVKAAENAEYIINHRGDFGYALMNDFKDLFNGWIGDVEEDIWTIDYVKGIEQYPYGSLGLYYFCAPSHTDYGGWDTMVSNKGTLDSFDDRDYRKKISFMIEAPVDGVMIPWTELFAPYPHVMKYLTPNKSVFEDDENRNRNVIIYRYAEVLLIAAEALNEINGGPTNMAYDYINQVRARARNYNGVQTEFPPNLQTGMSQDEFRNAVLEERRVELAFEFKRWFDIKRRGLIMSVFGPDSPEPHPNVQTYHELYPIPQSEIDRNPNLTQNPGYN